VLSIGWRATEKPFLALLKNHLQSKVTVQVVAGEKRLAETPIGNLSDFGIQGDYRSSRKGFTEFIVDKEFEEFIGRLNGPRT
jgi:hypothetical protein